MTEKKIDVQFKVSGTGWKARGHLKGSPSYLEELEKVFQKIEDDHVKEDKGAQ